MLFLKLGRINIYISGMTRDAEGIPRQSSFSQLGHCNRVGYLFHEDRDISDILNRSVNLPLAE